MENLFALSITFAVLEITISSDVKSGIGVDISNNFGGVKSEVPDYEFESDYDTEYAGGNPSFSVKREGEVEVTGRRSRKRKFQKLIDSKSIFYEEEEETNFESDFDKKEIPAREIRDKLCRICHVEFKFYYHYETHFGKDHPNEKPYSCPYCPLEMGKKRGMFHHIRKSHAELTLPPPRSSKRSRLFRCGKCGTEHRGMKEFELHNKSHHKGEKMLKCGSCNSKFTWFHCLKTHEIMKHGKRGSKFQCKICKSFFARSDDFEKHASLCEERHTMKKSGVSKVDMRYVDNVINDEYRKSCYECGEKFGSLLLLKRHFRTLHPQSKGCFGCRICGKRFLNVLGLERHESRMHADECEPTKKYRRGRIYKCVHCGRDFRGLHSYEEHGISAHDEPLFLCGECGKGFFRKRSLEQHVVGVHGKSTIRCGYCVRLFKSRGEKNRHEKPCERKTKARLLENTEEYCDVCDEIVGGTKESLHKHKLGHKYYEYCKFCHDRFKKGTNPSGLANHMVERHQDRADNADNDGGKVKITTAAENNSASFHDESPLIDDKSVIFDDKSAIIIDENFSAIPRDAVHVVNSAAFTN